MRIHILNLVLACALVTPTLKASVSYGVGAADFSQGFPFNRSASNEYQQGYAASVFQAATSGPLVINSVTFFDTKAGVPAATSVSGGTYVISFYMTSNAANNLNRSFAANEGTFLGTFFSGTLGGQMTTANFTINGTPFTYDPSKGNLVMDIIATVNPTPVGSAGFDLVSTNPQMGRVINLSGTGGSGFATPGGLVTTFGLTITPEPSSMVFLCIGLAAMVLLRGRKS